MHGAVGAWCRGGTHDAVGAWWLHPWLVLQYKKAMPHFNDYSHLFISVFYFSNIIIIVIKIGIFGLGVVIKSGILPKGKLCYCLGT
jgi:hypothetical protein